MKGWSSPVRLQNNGQDPPSCIYRYRTAGTRDNYCSTSSSPAVATLCRLPVLNRPCRRWKNSRLRRRTSTRWKKHISSALRTSLRPEQRQPKKIIAHAGNKWTYRELPISPVPLAEMRTGWRSCCRIPHGIRLNKGYRVPAERVFHQSDTPGTIRFQRAVAEKRCYLLHYDRAFHRRVDRAVIRVRPLPGERKRVGSAS